MGQLAVVVPSEQAEVGGSGVRSLDRPALPQAHGRLAAAGPGLGLPTQRDHRFDARLGNGLANEGEVAATVEMHGIQFDLERARATLDDEDTETFDDALWEVAEQLDTPRRHLGLAQAVIALKDAGKVDPKVAAVAVFDLSEGASSRCSSPRSPSRSAFQAAKLALPPGCGSSRRKSVQRCPVSRAPAPIGARSNTVFKTNGQRD